MLSVLRGSVGIRRFALKTVPGVNASPAGAEGPPDEKNTVPFIPREFAKDTIEFFRQTSSPHIKSLLDLVFSSPGFKSDLTEEENSALAELEEIEREYAHALADSRKKYDAQLEKARRAMFHAIQNLPEDMYEEAVQKGEMLPPESLQFHEMYKEQLMKENLSDWEQVKLQTFSNLMHIRYSHSEAKKKHKDRFFISESAALNLRKERAKQEKGAK